MTPQEREHVHDILRGLSHALDRLRESGIAFDEAIAAVARANHAQGDAIEGIAAANKAVIHLLSEE